MAHKYIDGDHWVIDDISGQQHRSSVMRKNWKGQMVSPENYEEKHPQLEIRIRGERIGVKDARPPQEPKVIDPKDEIKF